MKIIFFSKNNEEVIAKATVLREVLIPGYTRSNGTYVPSHRKHVHINDDVPIHDVVTGNGSHSQRAAHRDMSSTPGWHEHSKEDKYSIILAEATPRQLAATAAAAISKWRQRALAGQNPTAGQWAAFANLPLETQVSELTAVRSAVGNTDFLSPDAGLPAPVVQAAPVPVDVPAALAAPVVVTDSSVDDQAKQIALDALNQFPGLGPGDDSIETDLVFSHPFLDIEDGATGLMREGARVTQEQLSFNDLYSTQDSFDRSGVAGYINGEGRNSDVIRVVRMPDGKLLLHDGHHRAIAAKLLGKPIMAEVSTMSDSSHIPDSVAAALSDSLWHHQATAPEPEPAISVNGQDMTRNQADGTWSDAAGNVSAPRSALGIAASIVAGDEGIVTELAGVNHATRERAVELVVNSGLPAQTGLDLLFSGGRDGVQEGDTKVIYGVTYVLHDGRWHRQDEGGSVPTEPTAIVPSEDLNARQYHNTEGNSRKFWNVAVDGNRMITHWGRIGSLGVASVKEFASTGEANEAMQRKILAKQSRGYDHVGRATIPGNLIDNAIAANAVVHPSSDVVIAVADNIDRVAIDSSPQHQHYRSLMSGVSEPVLNAPLNSEIRRLDQLSSAVHDGDYDAVINFTETGSGSDSDLINNYRLNLIAAVERGVVTPSQVAQAMATPIPGPPSVHGANRTNSALISGERKIAALYAAATSPDPVPAILSITTSLSNGYTRAGHEYKIALLRHFGYTLDGSPLVDTAEVASAAVIHEPIVTRPRGPTSTVVVPPSQNPLIAANPYNVSEAVLGFVPRPNVPLSVSTSHLPSNYVWPHPEMAELNRRYLAQPTTLQTRAREYQGGSYIPQTPEIIAKAKAAKKEAALKQARADRAALGVIADRLSAMDDLYRPMAVVGANVTSVSVASNVLPVARELLGIATDAELRNFARTIVADYGGEITFKAAMTLEGNKLYVQLDGSDGTRIRRDFYKSGSNVIAHHGYFAAGRTGAGSAKHLFRTSMGLYKTYGVTDVKVHANIDVGNYVWARFGYVPDRISHIKAKIKDRLQSISSGTGGRSMNDAGRVGIPVLPESVVKNINTLLKSDDPKVIWEIADMKHEGRSIGKDLLLGSGMDWFGTMTLNDADTMRRFNAYVGG